MPETQETTKKIASMKCVSKDVYGLTMKAVQVAVAYKKRKEAFTNRRGWQLRAARRRRG